MFSLAQIWSLLKNEFRIEFREKYAAGGILLYVACSVFIVMVGFKDLTGEEWNVIFWILFLFASTNAVLKSFVRENRERYLYFYSLTHPVNLLFSKVIYNTFLLVIIGSLILLGLTLIAGNEIDDYGIFFLSILMGSFSVSLCFTFVSSIAVKAENSSTLLAILSFPLIIPVFVSVIQMTAVSMGLRIDTNITGELFVLSAIQLLLCGAGIFLFPFLWRS